MKLFLRIAFVLLLCLGTLMGYAQGQDIESNIPEVAFKGRLERCSFEGRGQEQTEYDVYSESDFKKIDYTSDVLINLREDITLSAPLTIKSKKTVQIEGNGHTISDGWRKTLEHCSEVYQARSWTYDPDTKLCTMTLPDGLDTLQISEEDSVYIAYELWFVRQTDKVVSARNGKLTFRCQQHYKPTAKIRKAWTSKPMFYLMYSATDSAVRSFKEYIIHIEKGTQVKISNLRVENCPGGAILSEGDLYVKSCTFSNVDGTCIYAANKSYLDVTGSCFSRCGLKGSNEACIKGAANIYVGNCRFEDFNYCAIWVGRGSTTREADLCSATIENNVLSWSEEWRKTIRKYGLRDGGAIYVATNNRRVIIRNNTITGFGGHGHNRSIFCDDGAYNLTIYGNRITGTQNSYDIDSRDCSQKPIRKTPQGYNLNTNNYIMYNDCSGRVRLQPSTTIKAPNCLFEKNT